MFTTVHSARVIALVTCALFLLNALPLVVHSQEDSSSPISDSQEIGTTTEAANATSSLSELLPAVETVPVVINPYATERLPGDGDYVAGDFVVGPGKIDVTAEPGVSKTVEMIVSNRTGERRRFNLTIEDAAGSRDPETSIVLLGDDRGPYSMKDYISVPAMSFELGHNERARIPVTITLPKDAEPGGLYGSVLVDTVAVDAVKGDPDGTAPQSAIIARIGTLFFITIPGDIARDGGLSDFATVPKQMFYQSGPIPFGVFYENKGNMHLAPYGEIRIRNMFDEEVGSVVLEPWLVLPQSLRLREVTWNREFLFGRYTATIAINRSYDDIIDTAEYSFWVLPWKFLLAGFGALFVVIFIIRAFFRTFEFKRK